MSNLIGRLLRGLTFSLPLIAASAVAQEAGEGEGVESASGVIEELLVTARRREENVQEVPIPVTALSGQDLKDRAADEVRDLMRITPNMDFQQAGSAKNTAQVFLRGIGQVNWAPTQDPKIGIYVDGVYIAAPKAPFSTFWMSIASRSCAAPKARCLVATQRLADPCHQQSSRGGI